MVWNNLVFGLIFICIVIKVETAPFTREKSDISIGLPEKISEKAIKRFWFKIPPRLAKNGEYDFLQL